MSLEAQESRDSATKPKPATTIIELSAYENAHTKSPPTVTGTVYETRVLPEDPFDSDTSNGGRRSNFHKFDDSLLNVVKDSLLDHEHLDALLGVEGFLKTRVAEILKLNPWLAGRIVPNPKRRTSGGSLRERISRTSLQNTLETVQSRVKNLSLVGDLALEFPTELTHAQALERSHRVVRIVTTSAAGAGKASPATESTTSRELQASLSPSACDVIVATPLTDNTYEEIVDAVRPMLHASTESVVGTNGTRSLWDVLLIPLTESTTSQKSRKFLLVHALNACLGDPATLYKLYAMLGSDRPVERLDPTRCPDLEGIKETLLGGEDPNFLRSKGVLSGIAKRLVRVGIGSHPSTKSGPNETSLWKIDQEAIEHAKKAYQHQSTETKSTKDSGDEPSVPYISTNDVLTSWFLSQNQDSAIGYQLADLRGRHPKIPADKAGNYETEILYNPGVDTQTPAWIRASLTREDGVWKRHGGKELPGIKTLSGGIRSKGAPGCSFVSNWSSLYARVVLTQAEGIVLQPLVHLPIRLQHGGLFDSIGWNSLLVFRYAEDALGALVQAPSSATENDGGGFLDGPALFAS